MELVGREISPTSWDLTISFSIFELFILSQSANGCFNRTYLRHWQTCENCFNKIKEYEAEKTFDSRLGVTRPKIVFKRGEIIGQSISKILDLIKKVKIVDESGWKWVPFYGWSNYLNRFQKYWNLLLI